MIVVDVGFGIFCRFGLVHGCGVLCGLFVIVDRLDGANGLMIGCGGGA